MHAVFIGQNLVFSVSLPLCFSLGLGIWGVVDESTKTKLLQSTRLKVMNIVSTCMKILIKIKIIRIGPLVSFEQKSLYVV